MVISLKLEKVETGSEIRSRFSCSGRDPDDCEYRRLPGFNASRVARIAERLQRGEDQDIVPGRQRVVVIAVRCRAIEREGEYLVRGGVAPQVLGFERPVPGLAQRAARHRRRGEDLDQ